MPTDPWLVEEVVWETEVNRACLVELVKLFGGEFDLRWRRCRVAGSGGVTSKPFIQCWLAAVELVAIMPAHVQ